MSRRRSQNLRHERDGEIIVEAHPMYPGERFKTEPDPYGERRSGRRGYVHEATEERQRIMSEWFYRNRYQWFRLRDIASGTGIDARQCMRIMSAIEAYPTLVVIASETVADGERYMGIPIGREHWDDPEMAALDG
jgi:hypothetical protein